jgi:alkylation response protein AidB-like acyl-CoA dehydrogenase
VGRSIRAADGNGSSRLTGTARIVVDAQVAHLLVVAASDGDRVALYAVDPAAAGVTITPVQSIDATRKLSRVTFANAPAERLGDDPVDLDALWDRLAVALAHEMIGGAQRLFDGTVEYLKIRVQFGRPIGSFQALKHRCADLLTELELAKAATYAAAQQLATGEGDPFAPNMAKAMASEAYMEIAKQAIQLRGGIGFTWEDDTHLWFKRAKSSEVFLGTPAWHRERMIQKLEAEHA